MVQAPETREAGIVVSPVESYSIIGNCTLKCDKVSNLHVQLKDVVFKHMKMGVLLNGSFPSVYNLQLPGYK